MSLFVEMMYLRNPNVSASHHSSFAVMTSDMPCLSIYTYHPLSFVVPELLSFLVFSKALECRPL